MYTINDYFNTYDKSWSPLLQYSVISENKNWVLFDRYMRKRTMGTNLHKQRILLNKFTGFYFDWQSINHNVWVNSLDKKNEIKKWIGYRKFSHKEDDINKLVNVLFLMMI